MDKDHIEKLLEQHVAQISEHVGSVQIVVTAQDGSACFRYSAGAGCWYSRMGAMREMVIRDNAAITHNAKEADEE